MATEEPPVLAARVTAQPLGVVEAEKTPLLDEAQEEGITVISE